MATDNTGKKKFMPFILGGVLLVAGYFGFKEIRYLMGNEDTENSQLETNIVPVLPKVGGWVTAVLVKDNQRVNVGDTLVKIDDRELKIKVQQAEVALKNAQANVTLFSANASSVGANVGTSDASIALQNAGIDAATATIATAMANVESAKIRIWRTTQDFNRYSQLVKEKSAPQQQLDNAKADKETAEAALVVAQSQVESAQKAIEIAKRQVGVGSSQKAAAQTQVGAAQQQINVARLQIDARKAELDLAQLQLSYAAITAPLSGLVSRKNVQLGQLVNAGQPLMSIVDDSNVWVVANFKETQIGKMQVGQKVRLKVDAYKNRDFEGTIESFAAATGAKFSLLPADNASGNFVKVVQRVPTKILISNKSETATPLRAGMSVEVIVPVN